MSEVVVQLRFTALFKRRFKGLAKKYRQIQADIDPVLVQTNKAFDSESEDARSAVVSG